LELRDWITIVALVTGPAIAVGISLWAQNRDRIRNKRLDVFETLLAYRQDAFNPRRVKALCLIDIAFHNVPTVRAKWKEYFDALSDPQYRDGQNDAVDVWRQKQNVMLAEMARVLGYGSQIGYEEITRAYAPKQYNLNFLTSRKLQSELLRVLENSQNFGTPQQLGSSEQQRPGAS
jgi:hypothetical protein